MPAPPIRGIHHFTYCVGGAQEDVDFHTKVLGLRMLKQTGLYEGEVPIYHLYYGNTDGDPGTVLTTFPMRQQGVVGSLGTNQVSRLNLSIPKGALGFWMDRLERLGVDPVAVESCGIERIHFAHPSGVPFGLVADGFGNPDRSWDRGGVAAEHAILGSHGMTIDLSSSEEMITYLEDGLGAVEDGSDDRARRWRLGFDPYRIGYVELVENRESPPGTRFLGEGTIHHCAWDVPDSKAQTAVRTWLESLGYDQDWLGPRDRGYFVSVYNRTPSGALFELAWSKPQSWTVDEAADDLGHTFKIPPMFMSQADTIVDYLEPIKVDV